MQAALLGINAAVVGLLLAALYRPVWTSAIFGPADFALGLVAFLLLALWAVPPWLVVILGAVAASAVADAIERADPGESRGDVSTAWREGCAMAITMYDLCGAEAERRFSPFCWRTRMALAHKGLEVETVPWRFTEKDKLPQPNAGRVPVIVDGGRVVHDSTAIADYLEERYPDRPSLFGGETGRGADALCAELDRDGVADRADPARAARHPPPSRPRGPGLFPQDREKRFGTTLEEVVKDREARLPAFRASLDPLRRTVERQDFVSAARRRPMPITSCSARSSGPARSAISSCWRPTIRCAPGAAACSTCIGGLARRAPAYGG